MKILMDSEPSRKWNVLDMWPGKSEAEVSEILADHFNAIARNFVPLTDEDVFLSYSRDIPDLTRDQVSTRLRTFKKPASTVPGDLPPTLVTKFHAALSTPVTDILNAIKNQQEWPRAWQIEYVTPIPKVPCPDTLNQLRNIGCTNLLSKLAESYVLEWTKEEVEENMKRNQFGGRKGMSTNHHLISLWESVLKFLDKPGQCVSILGIDFSKSFNRIDHRHCLSSLKRLGASSQVLGLHRAFLKGRKMSVGVGSSPCWE